MVDGACNIVSFSGGKDSTAMLLMMLDRNIPIDKIICVDMTKEFPQMYDYIRRVEEYIQLPITIIPIEFDYWFSKYTKKRGKWTDHRGYGWPDYQFRWCTGLKVKAIQKYIKELPSHKMFIGIAYCEKNRVNKWETNKAYPLIEWKITSQEALQYCYSHGFNWGGLYEKFHRVSCYCCPLQRISELRIIYNDYPDLWQKMQDMDNKSWRQFRSDYSLDDLMLKFNSEQRNSLFTRVK